MYIQQVVPAFIRRTKYDLGVKKDIGIFGYRMYAKNLFVGLYLDTADKVAIILLPLIKKMVGLISSTQNCSLTQIDNSADKRSFSPVAFCEKELARNAVIEIETKV